MDWIEGYIETSKAGLEIVSGFLFSEGITGLVIHDEDEFEEFLNDPAREWDYIDDGLAQNIHGYGITFYLRANDAGREDFELIKSGLLGLRSLLSEQDLGSLNLSVKNVHEEDWANNWKKYFKPFPVSRRLLICPGWEEPPADNTRQVLTIDPGNVFGSGIHESTRTCLFLIDKYMDEDAKILDIGSGSGILSIGAMLLGAKSAVAVDIDKNAAPVALENARLNSLAEGSIEAITGDIMSDDALHERFAAEGYDIVAANIVADIIINIGWRAYEYLRPGGVFISGGIIAEREEEVADSLITAGFEVLEIVRAGAWRSIAARR
ncbi:MAG: 50S ribosomal protein L11 methyltransferase [Firmicutes bacterium]|nr:50S ribosomal protein L11 methyltransferase [Bacillota bacterium]